jgi:hypothetical protein
MAINWNDIRPFNNSQNNAFEELVCQLAREEVLTTATGFYRIAAPDGGVEAYCVMPGGEEHGWQAKYFFSVEASQWTQLTESFERALKTHPNLSKYYIAIPLDRQDPRKDKQKWFMDKWNEQKVKWIQTAKGQGRSIEIEYWGSSELIHRLSSNKHAGRKRFWFGKEDFSEEWFSSRLEAAILDLGERYTAELNVHLPISKAFDSLEYNQSFRTEIRNHFHFLIKEINAVLAQHSKNESLKVPLEKIFKLQNQISQQFEANHGFDAFYGQSMDIEALRKVSDALLDAARECQNLIQDRDRGAINLIEKVREFERYIRSKRVALSNQPWLLLAGEAGMGKSHLLADVALRNKSSGAVSILLLGQHFTSDEPPWTQIFKSILRINCNEDEFLGALNALGEAQGQRLLFMIDAINEGRGRYFWPAHIVSFINKFSKYPWIGLVLSIRSSYVDLIAPPNAINKTGMVELHHVGFANLEHRAVNFFFSQYKIEQPNVPFLKSEFSNPLFLKLFCEGLKKANLRRIPKGYEGITSIINFFLSSINKKLSSPSYFDYPDNLNLVLKTVSELLEYKFNNNIPYVSYEKAFELAEENIKKYSNKHRFLDALISEGVLSRNAFWVGDKNEEGIYLAYERFEDHIFAGNLIERYLDKDNPKKAFTNNGPLTKFLSNDYSTQGILEALSILMPEKIDSELYELIENERSGEGPIKSAFIYSLIWRKYDSLDSKIYRYINEHILPYDDSFNEFFQILYLVAAEPNHLLNADSLHQYLFNIPLPHRDQIWTTYSALQDHQDSSINRLIEWARLDEDKGYLSYESRLLCGKAISWLFTSTNIAFRDSATKGLAALLKNSMDVSLELLKAFENVDDPYVYERVIAAVYGALLQSDGMAGVKELANYLLEVIFKQKEVYPNALVRDYSRNIIEYALFKGLFKLSNVNVIRPPYKSSFPKKFPTNQEIDKYKFDYKSKGFKNHYWAQNEIIDSMTTEYGRGVGRYGDFGRYTFQSRLDSWDMLDPQKLSNYACKLIFKKYGYDVDKHGPFDRNYAKGDRHRNLLERIGKKYQWMSLYEVIARVSDNYKMRDPSSGWREKKKYFWYQGPWEPSIRNIDPTGTNVIRDSEFKLPKVIENNKSEYNDWTGTHEKWLIRKDDLPDPISVIRTSANNGSEWVTLNCRVSWKEPLPPGGDYTDSLHKELIYDIDSYFVHEEQEEEILHWIDSRKFVVDRFPDGGSQYQIFSREYYWSPAYRFYDDPYHGRSNWSPISIFEDEKWVEFGSIMSTIERHHWETGSGDDSQLNYQAPRYEMFKGMELSFSRNIGEWLNKNGELVCLDPSVSRDGKSSLIIRKSDLLEFLKKNKLKIFWTCFGEKRISGGGISRNYYPKKWINLFGLFKVVDGEVVGILSSKTSNVEVRANESIDALKRTKDLQKLLDQLTKNAEKKRKNKSS